MFLASLLYLPVFMSGLMFHRLYNNWQTCLDSDSATLPVVPSVLTIDHDMLIEGRKREKVSAVGKQVRPPVAYASVAPFPFLPA
ncbi:hypothetical protein PJK47_30640, partial [Mycobacterium kansasii]